MNRVPAKKALGQHWLNDLATLEFMAQAAGLRPHDTVLEVGPGLGSLTAVLATAAKQVVAIEKDEQLAAALTGKWSNVAVVSGDILTHDLGPLPVGYKLVANIPYYLTSHLLRTLLESPTPPALAVLMVQKEVAERVTAVPPQMTILGVTTQFLAKAELLRTVPRQLFRPPPKVDSAILRLVPNNSLDKRMRKQLFRIVKAGFSGRRKQLKNSLAAGLHLKPAVVMAKLQAAGIDPAARAQELPLSDWRRLSSQFEMELEKL